MGKRTIYTVLTLTLAVLVGAFVWFEQTGGLLGKCKEEVTSTGVSSDDEYTFIKYTTDCGATTLVSTSIALEAKGDVGRREDVFVTTATVDVVWTDNRTLTISSIKAIDPSEVYLKKAKWKGVTIKYVY